MATLQVKFYSKASLPSTIDQNGLYFIQNGELYKGSQRFGLGRVTNANTEEALNAITDMARGDINVGYQGAKVYDGTTWQQLGGDIASLQSSWRSDIATWTAGLSTGGEGSYITGITQDNDGKVSATAVAFPTLATGDANGEVKLGSVSAKVNGWDNLVSSVSDIASSVADIASTVTELGTDVSGLKSIVDVSNSAVTATTGSFTELTVTSTATFNVTAVSTDVLTINGSTVEEIADAEIAAISEATSSSSSNGITVGVTTEGGSIKAVTVNASAFGNVIHFRDVVSNTADVSDAMPGDIVVIGSNADTGFVTGQEYICTASAVEDPATPAVWEVIGDQTTYATNAYSSTATVYTGATTLPAAINAAGSAIDTLTSDVATLSSTIAAFSGGTSSSTAGGVTASVTIDASTMAPSVSLGVDVSALASALGLVWITEPEPEPEP